MEMLTVARVLAELQTNQLALLTLTVLELTGYLLPPSALLRDGDSFDYIIIGGGTAGSVIATRLVQKKYNVLLVEAGEDPPYEATKPSLVNYLMDSHYTWNYTTKAKHDFQCQVNKTLKTGIGKMLGGTGELNYMVYSRGNKYDYDKWHRITKDPIWKWKNILPYFKKSENVTDQVIRKCRKKSLLFGTKGYIGVTRDQDRGVREILKGFKEAGNKIIADIDGNRNGYSNALLTINFDERQGSGTRYLSHITNSHYIATAKKTLVTKIMFHANKTVSGIKVITDENKKVTIRVRKEIIVTCGAIKSPQLLMLSGIGPKEELDKFKIKTISNLPVGKNLQDHVGIFIPYKTNKKLLNKTIPPGKFPAAVFIGYGSVNESSWSDEWKNDTEVPEYILSGKLINDMSFLLQFCASVYSFNEKMCDDLHKKADNNMVMVNLLTNLRAHSRGQVLLRSKNPKVAPKIVHPGFSDRRDYKDFLKYVSDYSRVETTPAFKKLGIKYIDMTKTKCSKYKEVKSKYWRCQISCLMISLRSFGGTCAMGSVVDSRLRVLGVHGLRVADASIMPTLVSGVAYNTVVMIGEKAAHIIIEDAGKEYNSMQHEKIRPDQIKNM